MFVALVRRTLAVLALATIAAVAVAASATAATVVNGDFEAGDLSGWTQSSSAVYADWSAYTGTTNPHNSHTVGAPPEGSWAAVSGQTGTSRTILYQDIELEPGYTHALSLQAYYTNENAVLISPDTLDVEAGSNQQYRIDVLRATAPVDSVDPADVLATIFRTQPGDANIREPFPLSSDLSAFAGQTVRLRFALVSTDFFFSASADDVRIASVPDLRTSPATLSFGRQDIDDGPAADQTSRLINDSPDPVTLSALSLSGDTTQFEHLTGDTGDCTATTALAVGEGCDLRVRFDPTATGAKTATLTIATSAGDRTVALTGTGTQPESTLSPGTLAFGSQEIDDGPTVSQTSTVTNSGVEPVVLSGLTLSEDDTQFERLTGQTGDCTADTTLGAGQTCDVRVRFDPSSVGAKAATLTVTSNTPDHAVALAGTGIHTELTSDPEALPFGSIDIDDGPTTSQTSTLANSGTEPVTLSGLTLSGDTTQFERLTGDAGDCTATTTLAAAETCDLRTRFDPTSTGAKAATLTIASNSADRTIGLTGTGIQTDLSLSAAALPFGSIDIDDGATTSQTSTLTNSGTEPITLSGLTVSADAAQFERLTGNEADCTAPSTLASGDACDVRVRFDPTATGAMAATLTIASSTPDRTIALTGSGIQTALSAGPTALAFGMRDIDDGPTVSQSSTVTNSGTEPITLSGLTVSADAAQFERLTGNDADCTATTTLAAGDACDVRLRFDPGSTGAKAATLTIASGAADRHVALTGTGVQADADGDGISDRFDTDDDGDGTPDSADAFPLDAAESIDTDRDGIGNNADADDDGDGTPDSADAFPLDFARQQAVAPSLPGAVKPWMLTRIARVKVVQRRTAMRVSTGYIAVCPAGGPACSGRLTLKVLRRSPATGKLLSVFLTNRVALTTLPAGSQRRVSFTLNTRGARLVRRVGSLKATLRGSMRTGASRAVVRTATLRISAPRRR